MAILPERSVHNRRCLACAADARKQYEERSKDRIVANRRRYSAENREKLTAAKRAWCARNRERVREIKRAWNAEHTEQNTARAARWAKANPERDREIHRRWAERNRSFVNARAAERRAGKRRQTPAWADLLEIEVIYEQARVATLVEGVEYHVDHIIPLRGETVCGLHVENNLQILKASINQSKSNRLILDQAA